VELSKAYIERAKAEGFHREPNILPSAEEERALELARNETEVDVTDQVRDNAQKAASKLGTLIDSVDVERLSSEDRIAAVRAIADAQNKSVDALMKMTGRDREAPRDNMADVLAGMAERGLLRMNVEIGPSPSE